jgi:hypothetical protein
MVKETPEQKATVRRVMHEYKRGELESGAGGEVHDRRQAVAIALSEAGASKRKAPQKNQESLQRTKAKERAGRTEDAEPEGKAAQDRTLHEGERGRRR